MSRNLYRLKYNNLPKKITCIRDSYSIRTFLGSSDVSSEKTSIFRKKERDSQSKLGTPVEEACSSWINQINQNIE